MKMNQIIHGDALEELRKLPGDSVDCVVTDPPYGYSFMGKDWDKAVPSVEIWKESLRVLKSGAFAFVMSSPRQNVLSQMIVRLGEAGFNMGFSSIYWCYASGFPKACNISKSVDKRLGLKREVIGKTQPFGRENRSWQGAATGTALQGGWKTSEQTQEGVDLTVPSSQEAKLLDGSYGGFQPKPAVEVILVCMKPLNSKTFVDQALKNGHGVTWLDDARIPFQNEDDIDKATPFAPEKINISIFGGDGERGCALPNLEGRFPANLLVSDDILNDGTTTQSNIRPISKTELSNPEGTKQADIYGKYGQQLTVRGCEDEGSFSRYFDLDKWFAEAVKKLPKEVQETFPFLITPKASKSERNKGLEKLPTKHSPHGNFEGRNLDNSANHLGGLQSGEAKNFHPCVKPLALMSYLITLGSRVGDVVVDPFCGSGTTCLSAKMLGRHYIGIEREAEYVKIAEARVEGLKTLKEFIL